MKKKIETLTESQKSKLPEYIEKWTKIGLSTEPANRQKAEEGVRMTTLKVLEVFGLAAGVVEMAGLMAFYWPGIL